MDRRLYMALAWGKWIAIRREEYEKAMEFYKTMRQRGNWGILVQDDEIACQYQRCSYRIRRAMRALGAWGMTGYATFDEQEPNATVTLVGVDFLVHAATRSELDQMNYDDFHRNDRMRAVKAKITAKDKRHPLAKYGDHCAEADAEAYEAELYSMRY